MTPPAGRQGIGARFGFLAGASSVTAGVLLAGFFTYLFLSLAGRVLGPAGFSPVSTLWALVFIVGPGLFLPVQQELGRVLAPRRAARDGAGAVRPGAQLTAAVTLGALAAGLAASPWLTRDLFGGSWALFWCFEASMVGYGASFLARGVYSGLGDFGGFAQVVACESVGRFALAGVLCLVGVRSAVGFGAAIAVAPLVATALVTRCGRRLRLAPGPVTGRRELLQAFGWLVVASLLGQLLANAAPIAVQVLAPAGEEAAAGRFLSALVVARVSLYLFQAVQATLLPNLAELSARGRTAELRTALRRLLVVGAGLVVVATAGAFVLGPFAVRTLFGPGFTLGAGTLAALAAASMVYVLAAALSNAAVAVSGHWLSTVAWMSGCAAFGVGTAVGRGLYGRVELGYLLGSCVAAAFLLVALPRAIRSHLPAHPRQADGGVTDPRPAA